MRLAKENGVKSIAFCCISTGVFGYPQEPAAKVALQTVKSLLESTYKDDFDLILFNVWTQKDHDVSEYDMIYYAKDIYKISTDVFPSQGDR